MQAGTALNTSQKLFNEETKGLDDGICSECSLRSRKLRICVTCALEQNVLKKDKGDIVLNIINDNIEEAIQKAKDIAICGDCSLDGIRHEGHKIKLLNKLKNNLDDMLVSTVVGKLETMADKLFSEETKGPDDGICSECSSRSRKLRICFTCALEQEVLKKDKGDIVLNIIDDKIEEAIQKAKGIAICGDCALDGERHEGHKTKLLNTLKNILHDMLNTYPIPVSL